MQLRVRGQNVDGAVQVLDQSGETVAEGRSGQTFAVQSGTYNTRTLAAEVLVDGDRFAAVRRPMTPEEQIARETIPDWLQGTAS